MLALASLARAYEPGIGSYVPPAPPPIVLTYTETSSYSSSYVPASSFAGGHYTGGPGPMPAPAAAVATPVGKTARDYWAEGDYASATPLLKLQCEDQGWPESCFYLGTAYELGLGIGTDLPAAVRAYTAACEGDEPYGCSAAAQLYLKGRGTKTDVARAAKYADKGCYAGVPSACATAGHADLELGKMPEATKNFAHACNLAPEWMEAADKAELCRTAGSLAYHGAEGVAPDPVAARNLFAWACKWGDGESCEWEGALSYEAGERTTTWFGMACERGRLGGCLRAAAIAPEPWQKADFWGSACALGDLPSCASAGHFHAFDRHAEAGATELAKACAGGLEAGCEDAEVVRGLGAATPEPDRRVDRLERACERFDQGCGALALYTADPVVAQQLRMRACGHNHALCEGLARQASTAGDWTGAAELDRIACWGGDPNACEAAIGIIERHPSPRFGPEEVDSLSEFACIHGYTELCRTGPTVEAPVLVDGVDIVFLGARTVSFDEGEKTFGHGEVVFASPSSPDPRLGNGRKCRVYRAIPSADATTWHAGLYCEGAGFLLAHDVRLARLPYIDVDLGEVAPVPRGAPVDVVDADLRGRARVLWPFGPEMWSCTALGDLAFDPKAGAFRGKVACDLVSPYGDLHERHVLSRVLVAPK